MLKEVETPEESFTHRWCSILQDTTTREMTAAPKLISKLEQEKRYIGLLREKSPILDH